MEDSTKDNNQAHSAHDNKMKRKSKKIDLSENHYKKVLLELVLTFLGGLIGAFVGNGPFRILFIFIGTILGIILGVILVLLLFSKHKNSYKSTDNKNIPQSTSELVNYWNETIQAEYILRSYAAERLRRNEFWLQTINIYYSCFTAGLALLSLKNDNELLTTASALFTVLVAILVTYANAQKYGNRSNDLRTNCNDLYNSLLDCMLLNNQESNFESCEKSNNINNVASTFIKKLGDSENYSVIDIWKKEKSKLYSVYLLASIAIIAGLIIIPILFVIFHWNDIIPGSLLN